MAVVEAVVVVTVDADADAVHSCVQIVENRATPQAIVGLLLQHRKKPKIMLVRITLFLTATIAAEKGIWSTVVGLSLVVMSRRERYKNYRTKSKSFALL
jgi:hypothetical protein